MEKADGLDFLRHSDVTWVNVDNPSHKDMDELARQFHFTALNLEDCLSKVKLPKIDFYTDHVFIILHFPQSDSQRNAITSAQTAVFLGKNYVVTVNQGDVKPLSTLFQTCKHDAAQRQAIMGKGPAYVLYSILDRMVNDLFSMLDKLLQELDAIEDAVFDERTEAVREVTILRRKIADLRRIVFPMRGLLADLIDKVKPFSNHNLSNYYRDVKDHIEKAWYILEECKETLEIYKDTEFMLNTERSNKILAILTIVFTLSIPASLIGTIYGMNVNLPGGIGGDQWTFLGPYTTFIILIIASTVPAILMLWIFRRIGWI